MESVTEAWGAASGHFDHSIFLFSLAGVFGYYQAKITWRNFSKKKMHYSPVASTPVRETAKTNLKYARNTILWL